MSITAKLHIDEKEFNILQFRYSIAQNSDYSGYPLPNQQAVYGVLYLRVPKKACFTNGW